MECKGFAFYSHNRPVMDLNTTDTVGSLTDQVSETDDVQLPWYAVRLFSNNLLKARSYFDEQAVVYFIPMQYYDYEDANGRHRRKLRPVVSNLIFVKKTMTTHAMAELMHKSEIKMAVMTKSRENREYYEIPPKQMSEFQTMCNPELEMRKFLSSEEAKVKVGTPVMVSHGPLKGLTGRLVRQSHKYFLLKEVPGMGVMLKVSRWCCKPLANDE